MGTIGCQEESRITIIYKPSLRRGGGEKNKSYYDKLPANHRISNKIPSLSSLNEFIYSNWLSKINNLIILSLRLQIVYTLLGDVVTC